MHWLLLRWSEKKSGGKCQKFNSSPILPPFWKRNQNARHLLSGKLTWQCRMHHLSSIVDENSLLKMREFDHCYLCFPPSFRWPIVPSIFACIAKFKRTDGTRIKTHKSSCNLCLRCVFRHLRNIRKKHFKLDFSYHQQRGRCGFPPMRWWGFLQSPSLGETCRILARWYQISFLLQ